MATATSETDRTYLPLTQLGDGGGGVPPEFPAMLADDDWHGPGLTAADILAVEQGFEDLLRGEAPLVPETKLLRAGAPEVIAGLGIVRKTVEAVRRHGIGAKISSILPSM